MQLQQLRYLVAAATSASIRAAAQKLFVSQSAISIAIKDLEQEMNVKIFERSSHGITLTKKGTELLGYAQRILDQVDIMNSFYDRQREQTTRFSVVSMHNLLVTKAFGDFLDIHTDEACDFELRETYTNQIIRLVSARASDLGIICMSNFNDQTIRRVLDNNDLNYTSLFLAQPYVVLGDTHPLAQRKIIDPAELAIYDRYELEQGLESSSYYKDEPISATPRRRKIMLSDNSSLAAILAEHNGYSITTGLSPANRSLTLIELDTDELMDVGFVMSKSDKMSALAREFIAILCKRILAEQSRLKAASAVFYYTRTRRKKAASARQAAQGRQAQSAQ